jgi:hypothetical protein
MLTCQNNATRNDIFEDLSKTASGMSVTCQSESLKYDDAANGTRFSQDSQEGCDEYVAAFEDYIKDDGTVTVRVSAIADPEHFLPVGKEGIYRNGAPVRERRAFLGNDDVADGVRVIRKGGVAYIRSGNRSVSVWSTATEHRAVCRCGWGHSVARHYVTRDGGHGPLTYDEMMSTALTLMKFVGIHDAWHRAND